jgi:hypothetical protein
LRARLDREHGTHANQILWRGQTPLIGDVNYRDQSILAVDRWLAAVKRDHRRIRLARKLILDKPQSITDRCTDGSGHDIDPAACDTTVQAYSDPQIQAGMPLTDDTLRCALKPLRRSDYAPVTFTDAEWARMGQLFPSGVCDFSKPGPGRRPTTPWQTYQNRRGRVIYGGRALGRPPRSHMLRRRRR